jgi:hypothetical protein
MRLAYPRGSDWVACPSARCPELNCRDEIIPILRALQHVHGDPLLRWQVRKQGAAIRMQVLDRRIVGEAALEKPQVLQLSSAVVPTDCPT